MPFDDDFDIRTHAARRLWRALNNRAAGPAFHELSPQRRQRLALALRALDTRADGNPYRVIAEVLFGARRIPERAWKTHDLRNRTIRLVQIFALMRGGYRELLRQSRRKRISEGYRKLPPQHQHPPSRTHSAIVTSDAPPTSPALQEITELF